MYTDVTLFTSHQQILKDVSKIFEFFNVNYRVHRYKHLIVSPHYTRSKINKLIEREIHNAENGKTAFIKLKLNSLTDVQLIDKLYDASNAGVTIQLQIRGICSLIPGVKGMSSNIEAISIVDNYLEHARIYIFSNDNDPEIFISSADFMTRNVDGRVVDSKVIKASGPGQDIYLNIDLDLQLAAESLLGDSRGALALIDVNDGSILSLVSTPAFDPNWFVGGKPSSGPAISNPATP